MTASARSLRSMFASTRNFFVVYPGLFAGLLLTIGLFCFCSSASANPGARAVYAGAYEAQGGQLTYPTGVAVDSSGNIYVALPALGTVEEIPASCVAGANNSTCAITLGGGFSDPTGVAVDGSGNVYVADTDNDSIKEISASCIAGDNNSGCVAALGGAFNFREPYGVAVDGSGNVYVADTFGSKVLEMTPGCILSSCVHVLGAGYVASPIGIAVDTSGNVYVGDTGNGTVDEIPYSCIQGANDSSCVTTLGGGFDSPYGVSVDGSGNVYVADAGTNLVSEIPFGCTQSSCVASVGGGFDTPWDVTVGADGNLYIADTSNWTVKRMWLGAVNFGAVPVYTGTPVLRTLIFVFTNGGVIGAPVVVTEGATGKDFTDALSGSCTTQGTGHVYAVNDTCTVDVNLTPQYPGERMGAVLLEDTAADKVLATGPLYGDGTGPQITFADTTSGIFAPTATTPLQTIGSPAQLAVDGNGNVYVASQNSNMVEQIVAGAPWPYNLANVSNGSSAVALDGAGNLYYADLTSGTVYEIQDVGGSYSATPVALANVTSPTGLAVDSSGNVFVTSSSTGKIYEIEAVNGIIPPSPAVVQLASSTSFNAPFSLAVDAADNVYVVGSDDVLFGITAASGYTTVNTLASFIASVSGVALDAAGDIFVSSNNSIYEVMAVNGSIPVSPVINTVGSGFNLPRGVALDASGNVYVSDTGNNLVDELDFKDAPALNFAATSIGFTSSDSPQTVAVVNNGNQTLTFSGLGSAIDFPLASSGGSVCTDSSTLAESVACTLPFDFTPENTSSLSESVTLTDNTLNATNLAATQQTVTLAAYGNPAPDTTTTDVSVGSSSLNTGQTVTVTATVSDTGVRGTYPTGSVVFTWSCSGVCAYDSSNNANTASGSLNGGTPVNLVNGVATLSGVSFNTAGTYTITASYSGVSETFLSSDNTGQSDSNNQITVGWTAATASAPVATNLNSVNLGSSGTQMVTFNIVTAGSIGAPVVVTQGATGLDFTDVGDGTCTTANGGGYGYNAGDTCTVDVKFAPNAPGTRTGAVLLEDNAGNLLATALVYGVGDGPQAIFGNDTAAGTLLPYSTTALGGGFSNPNGVAVDASGDVFVADYTHNLVKEIPAGCITSACVSTLGSSHTFVNPNYVALDGAGNVYVTDGNTYLTEIVAAGGYSTVNQLGGVDGPDTGFYGAGGVAVDPSGNIYVVANNATNSWAYSVQEIPVGCTTAACVTFMPGSYTRPYGAAVDGSGNLFVADMGANAVIETPAGCSNAGCRTVVGSGFVAPAGVAVDGSGNLYVSDYGDNYIYAALAADGFTNVYALSAGSTFAGPMGVAVDASGNVYVGNSSGDQVQKMDFVDQPSLSFATTAIGSTSSDSPQTVAVVNDGNTALSFSVLTPGADFPLASSGGSVCSTSIALAADSLCTLPIDFTPVGSYPYSTAQPLSENLALTDNSLNNASASQSIQLSATAITPTITFTAPVSTTLAAGTVGVSYSVSFTATGGAAPYSYSDDTLPPGLTLSSNGTLSGTPTVVETSYNINVTATDNNGFTGSQNYTLTIAQGTATINITPYSVTYTTGNPHTATGTATGYNSLDLSAGLTLTGTTHTNAGNYTSDSWSFTDPAGNYASTSGTVSDTISQATATINITSYNVNFDGSQHSASGTAIGFAGFNLGGDLDLSGTVHTVAGSYTSDSWSFTDPAGNYAPAGGTVSDSITMVPATASAPAATNFGPANLGLPATQTVTFTMATAGAIGVPVVVTEGATGLDFTDVGDGTCTTINGNSNGYSAGATCTVDVQFSPQSPGMRYGAVLLEDPSGNILATAYIYGQGTGPQINFMPGTQTAILAGGLSQPDDVAVDESGSVYIASYANNGIIRETYSSGTYNGITIFTGMLDGLTLGPQGLAVDGAGNLYIADTDNSRVLVETWTGGGYAQGATISSGLSAPSGVAVDGSGNVYIADSSSNSVYVETLSGGNYSLTNTFSGFSGPTKVAVDGSGNVYIADPGNNTVWMETLSGGSYSQSAIQTGLNNPTGVAVDLNGNVYIADQGSNTIWKETLAGGSYGQSALITGLDGPAAVALDGSGNLYIADSGDNTLYKQDLADAPTLNFNSTAVGFSSSDSPQTVTVNNYGNTSLIFSGLSTPTDFPLGSTGAGVCAASTTLTANTTCTLPIDFTPLSTNALFSENLSLNDNSLNNTSASQSITLNGSGVAPTITFSAPASTTLTQGTVGVSYNVNFTVTGGTAPYSYTADTLPPGLSLSSDGTLSGTPTAVETAYSINVTATDNNSFTGSQGYTLTIGQGTASFNITPYSVTYDGNAHTATGTATGYSGVDLSSGLTLTGTTHTNAASYPSDAWSFHDASGNYADAGGTVSDTILQATASIDVTPYSVTYDGNPHTASATATGVGSVDLSADLTLSGTTHTNAGSYPSDAWSFTDPTGNYASANGTVSDSIGQATASINITPYSVNYDGNQHTAGGTATGVGSVDLSADLNLSGTAHTSVGSYPNDAWSFTDPTGNYASAGSTVSDTILQVTATASAPTPYSIGLTSMGSPGTTLVTFTFQTVGSIGAPVVVTEGATELDFTDVGDGSCNTNGVNYDYGVSATCTVDVQFSPQYPGMRMGAVLLEDALGDILATAYVNGVGSGPMIHFSPFTESTLNSNFTAPHGVAADASGNAYLADSTTNLVEEIPAGCTGLNCLIPLGGGFSNPQGVAIDGAGNLYVADSTHGAVKEIPVGCTSSACVIPLGGGFTTPQGVAVDGSGNVYVADAGGNAVTSMTPGCSNSACVTSLGGNYAFALPSGVAVDLSGNVYVADTSNGIVEEMTAGCTSSSCVTVLGGAQGSSGFSTPQSVAVDVNGNVYVADGIKVSSMPANCLTAACVSNTNGAFSTLNAVAVDQRGDLLVADSGNHAVEELDYADAPSLSFNSVAAGSTSSDSPKTVTVSNDGNASLGFSGLSTATDFPLATSGGTVCSSATTLAANAFCTLPIDFTPTTNTLLNESLTLTDDSLIVLSAMQTISLTGTGSTPAITLTMPVSLTLPPGATGVPYSGATFQATGGASPYTYTATVPAGMSLSTGGVLSGTPSAAVTNDSLTVTATDSNGFTGSQIYSLTIGPGSATINVTPYDVTYDGNAHTATATATGVGGVLLSSSDFTLTTTTHTNAGTYSDSWSFHDPGGTYADANGTISDSIAIASATINTSSYNVTYDGNAHTATGTATGVGGANLNSDLNLTGTAHTNAGSYSIDAWSFHDASGNYSDANGTMIDTIATASATINVTPYDVTFDGGAHTATGTASGVGAANLNADLTLTNTTHTNAGSYSSDSWSFTDPSGNYSSANGTVSDSIAQASAAINVTPYNVTYDGAAHTATGTATGVGGVSLSSGDFTLTGSIHTNAGSYTADAWSFADASGNYSAANGTVADMIGKATAVIGVTPYNATYDGNAHTATATATGVGGASLSSGDFTLTATTHTNAGSYTTDAWSFADASGNYSTSNGTVSDVIAKATASVNIVPYNVAYDGNAHTATASATGVGSVSLSNSDLTLTGTTHTNAGSYAADAWSFADPSGNYAASSGTVADSISTATAAIIVTPYNVAYDGTAHTATASATGVGGASLSSGDFTLTGTTHTNAGSYATDAWSFTDASGNYSNASGTVSDSISTVTAIVTVTPYSVTYDGNAHTATATATGVGGVSLSGGGFTLAGTTHTNAGSYVSDPWSFTDASGNYSSASGTVSDSISKATASVDVTPYTATYDGTAHTASGTATGAGGASLSSGDFTLTGTTHTNAGAYSNDAWSFSDASGNYNTASGTVSDLIAKATAITNVEPYSVTYDGSAHTATATATGVGGASLSSGDFTLTGTTHTNAGSYTADAWSFADASGNYNSAGGTVSDTISTATATVNVTPYDVAYDGNAHTATATATGVGGALLSGSDFTLTGTTHTSAGSYPSDGWSFTDSSGNYAAASGTVSDAIAKASATINVTPYNVAYDSNAHTATATASGRGGASLSGSDFTLTGTTHTSAGSYSSDAWSFTDPSGNYTTASGTVSDTIAKASATVNVASYNVIYNGNAHTATATATGVGGVSLSSSDVTLTGTTHTSAGSYSSDAWSFADASGNYAASTGTVSDTIAMASASISVVPYDVAYNGSAHTATATATGVGGSTLSGSGFTLTGTTHTNVGTYIGDPWSFADASGNYLSASGAVTDIINGTAGTVTLESLSQTYTGAPLSATAITSPSGLTVSFTYTGIDGTIYGPTSNPPTGAGSYTVAGVITGSANYSGSASGTLVIAKADPQVYSLTSDSNPAAPGNPVTLVATISSSAGTPTGTVTFMDNTGTTIGQGTLANGVASLTLDFVTAQAGSNSITVNYSGDSNFLSISGGSLTETVTALTLSTAPGGTPIQTVTSGGTASYSLSLTPTAGTTYPMPVTLTVSGMPPGATAVISPSTWTQLTSTSWSLPANTALTTITLSIQLPAASSSLDERQDMPGRKLPPVLWGVLLLPFAYRLRRAGKRISGILSLLLLAASLTMAMALGGCGSGSGSSTTTQPIHYTITVTATADSISNSSQLTLVVN